MLGRSVRGEEFDGDVVHRPGRGGEQQDQQVRIEPLVARPHDHEHPDKAEHDGTPAAEANDLVKDEDGCQGRKERAGKGDGGRCRQRHHGDSVEPGRHRYQADRRPQQVEAHSAGTQLGRPALDDPREYKEEPEQAAKKGDLERVHLLRRDADQHVHHHRADPAEQNPQGRTGNRRELRRSSG